MDNNYVDEVEYVSKLKQNTSFDPDESVFLGIWKEYERVVLHSAASIFGLNRLFHDYPGGDVDTVKTVQKTGQFKNSRWQKKYENRGEYDTNAYHNDPNYRKMTSDARKQFNENGTTVPDTYMP